MAIMSPAQTMVWVSLQFCLNDTLPLSNKNYCCQYLNSQMWDYRSQDA